MIQNKKEMEQQDIETTQVQAKKKMGQFEKIFWITIAIFVIIWIILQSMTYFNSKGLVDKDYNSTILSPKNFETIIEDNEFLKKNLRDSQTIQVLRTALKEQNANITQSIDNQLDNAFDPVYNNIDTFLDYHYSVAGEYLELFAGATGEIAEEIKEQLFGTDFESYLKNSQDEINSVYIESLKNYLNEVDSEATKGVDTDLNLDILAHLTDEISHRFTVQYVKAGVVAGGKMSLKVINVVSSKLATKAGAKLATKVASKTLTKGAAASTAAAAGVACGPFAWVCSPVAAAAAWFGTDAIVISGDEYFNRDEFKNEIVAMLDSQKASLSSKLKNIYSEKLVKDSVAIQNKYENTPIKRRKIREQLSLK